MIHFLDLTLNTDKPWLILGKGPSFSKIITGEIDRNDYNLFGLNHVADILPVKLTNIIDIEVLSIAIIQNSNKILMPWHPHRKCKVQPLTLNDWMTQNLEPYKTKSLLLEAKQQGKLVWYNLSTWHRFHKDPPFPVIETKYFSVEAAIEILAHLGIKEINLLGIDGGTTYANEFKYLTPLENTRDSFDDQFKEIKKKQKRHNLTINNLGHTGVN